ncbi:MAG: glutathione S-transferase N-terminal domain-containing protein [bacterium]|nr:glutathione S-transferase N-terminal domain-containing protein [bacterium]
MFETFHNDGMANLILYEKTGCPWCIKVLDYAKERGIQFELRNLTTPGVAEELIKRGGKRQVPYLVDNRNGTEMYESADIIEYLRQN